MKPFAFFYGVVTDEPRLVEPHASNKKPFLSFRVVSNDGHDPSGKSYMQTVNCMLYGQSDINYYGKNLKRGSVVVVLGEVSSTTFESKREPGKYFGAMKMLVKKLEFIDVPSIEDASGAFEARNHPPTRPAAPQGRPASPGGNDEIPF